MATDQLSARLRDQLAALWVVINDLGPVEYEAPPAVFAWVDSVRSHP